MTSSGVPRVAVLPFKARTGDAELESFADGLTEEITSGLSQFGHLVVVSASAGSRSAGQADFGEIGRDLNARFLLQGSARKTGSRVRVNVQLVDATSGAQLWAERFDRDLGVADLLGIQDLAKIAVRRVSGALSRWVTQGRSGDRKRREPTGELECGGGARKLTDRSAVLRLASSWSGSHSPHESMRPSPIEQAPRSRRIVVVRS